MKHYFVKHCYFVALFNLRGLHQLKGANVLNIFFGRNFIYIYFEKLLSIIFYMFLHVFAHFKLEINELYVHFEKWGYFKLTLKGEFLRKLSHIWYHLIGNFMQILIMWFSFTKIA